MRNRMDRPQRHRHTAPRAPNGPTPRQRGPGSALLGLLAALGGAFLTGLTFAGALAGHEAIGFYDITIGGMCVAFGLQSVKFGCLWAGYEVPWLAWLPPPAEPEPDRR